MFDPRPFDADVEAIAHLTFVLRAELAAEECGDVVRPNGVNRRARQVFVDRLQIGLLAEDDIGGIFTLIHAPVVSSGEVPIDRATLPGEIVPPRMDALGLPGVGNVLRPRPVRDVREGVVGHAVVDTESAQLACQSVMTVPANLQAAGQPGRHAHMA